MRAWDYFYAGNRAAALPDAALAARLAAGSWAGLASVGGLYLFNGEPDKAALCFQTAAEVFPRAGVGDAATRAAYAQLWANAALALVQTGELPAAARAYDASLVAWPDQPVVGANAARVRAALAAGTAVGVKP
jgi:tetratricopeptide (TPR) repeat protein